MLLFIILAACSDNNKSEDTTANDRASAAVPDMDLHSAVYNENLAAIRQHIAAGSDINIQESTHDSSPLITAAAFGKTEAAKLLIEGKADLDYANSNGSTALHTAAVFGKIDVLRLLIDAGADLNTQNHDGATALLAAAFFGNIEIVAELLEHGADREIRNMHGATALDVVTVPFEEIIPVYDTMSAAFKSSDVQLNYDEISAVRPKIAKLLREKPVK